MLHKAKKSGFAAVDLFLFISSAFSFIFYEIFNRSVARNPRNREVIGFGVPLCILFTSSLNK